MRFFLFLLFIGMSLLHAADYSCDGEWVTNITGATNNQSASYSENTTGGNSYSRYFRFQTNVDGDISINIDKLSTRQEIYIGTTCGGTQLHSGGSNTSNYSGTFPVTAGTIYYIRIRERNGSNRIRFNISFDFLSSNVADLDLSEYQPPLPNPANIGDDISFYVQVKNQGSITADANITMAISYNQDVNISALVTPTYFSCSPSTGLLSTGDPILCLSTTDLNSGYAGNFTFTVKATGGGILEQNVLISSSSLESTLSNNELNSSVLYNLSSYCNEHSGSTLLLDGSLGFTRINPSGDVEKIYEVFCTNTTPSETLIALPNKNSFNNFVFNSTSVGSDYYSEANTNSTGFNAIKVSVNNDNTLIVDTAASNSGIGVMGAYFSNINLIGTPFAIDWANTTISGCDESKLRKGYHGQVVKINTLDYSNAQCKIENMQLKLLDDYTYLQYLGSEVLEPTCKLMAESVPISFLDSQSIKGHYWIKPAGGSRGGSAFTNSGRPIIAYCWYQTDLDWVWTFLLAMDGKRTIKKDDLINGQDSCSNFGLWPFVPNNETTFERVRRFLQQEKPEWINYTGTIQEKVHALYGNDYYLNSERPEPIWPYGSFGVYFPTNGNRPTSWGNSNYKLEGWMSGSPMHNQKEITQDYAYTTDGPNRNYYSHGNYSATAPTSSGSYAYTDTMGSKGWVSILGPNDLNKTDEWFISRTGAGDNFNNTDSDYPYYEPNGNYTAGCWLNYLFDSNGHVRHNDDWDCNYPYYDYMCMAEDNYDFTTRYTLIDGPFKAIERSTPTTVDGQLISTIDTNITTKIVNAPILLDVILLDDNVTRIDKTQSRDAYMHLMGIRVVGTTETPYPLHYFGQISDFNSTNRPTNNYEDDGRFSFEPSNWGSLGLETWSQADERVFVEFRYCQYSNSNLTTCWDNSAPLFPVCIPGCVVGTEGCDCQVADSNDFAIRPDRFKFYTDSNRSANGLLVASQRPYTISFQALDFTNKPSVDYNETQDISFGLDINRSDPTKAACIFNEFVINPIIKFKDGEDNRTTFTFANVGEYNVSMEEIPNKEFAIVDANDTPDSDRYITPFNAIVKIVPDHFDINVTLNNASLNDGNFTYLSNNAFLMGAELNITLTAEDFNNIVTPNYNTGCYADYVELNISHSIPLNVLLTDINVTDNNTHRSVNNSPFLLPSTILNIDINDTNFTVANPGVATLSYNINLNRNPIQPVDPFDLNITTLLLTSYESNISSQLTLDQNITYVYGRVHAPRYRINGRGNDLFNGIPTGRLRFYYEVFCSTCNPNTPEWGGAIGNLSVDSINWYQNLHHNNSLLGDINNTMPFFTRNPANFQQMTKVDMNLSDFQLNNGVNLPYKTTININASDWLIYDRFNVNAQTNSFELEFQGTGTKGGTQDGTMTDGNANVNSNRRILW